MSESLHEELDDSEPTWWELVSPAWMFRAKPTDYVETDDLFAALAHPLRSVPGSPCAGPYALRGLTGLFAVHFVSFGLPLTLWLTVGGSWWLWLLTIPTLLVWAVLFPADIKFRRQKPTRSERGGFDEHFINWFGFVTWPITTLFCVISLIWWVVSLFAS